MVILTVLLYACVTLYHCMKTMLCSLNFCFTLSSQFYPWKSHVCSYVVKTKKKKVNHHTIWIAECCMLSPPYFLHKFAISCFFSTFTVTDCFIKVSWSFTRACTNIKGGCNVPLGYYTYATDDKEDPYLFKQINAFYDKCCGFSIFFVQLITNMVLLYGSCVIACNIVDISYPRVEKHWLCFSFSIVTFHCGFELFYAGVVLGILTGIRGLCNGLGPALYGLLFFMFNVQIYESDDFNSATTAASPTTLAPPPNSTITPINSDIFIRSGVCWVS